MMLVAARGVIGVAESVGFLCIYLIYVLVVVG